MATPPCFDTVKKMDCPERSKTCHATCPRWKDYEKERDAEYKARSLIDNSDTIGRERTINRFIYKKRRRMGSTYSERAE